MKIVLVWILTALFFLNSLYVSLFFNFSISTLLLWLVTVLLAVYGIFHESLDTFGREGIGFALKMGLYAGMAIFLALFVFVAVSGYGDSPKGDEQAIIVLGAGLRGEEVSDVLQRRLLAALNEWKRNPRALIVVTGGQGPQELIPEGAAMEKWLVMRGVPSDSILVEDKSTSTEENLLFAREVLKRRHISADVPVVVVTNAFHCYRARRYAEKVGFSRSRTLPASMGLNTVLPSYIREVFAVLYFWLFKR